MRTTVKSIKTSHDQIAGRVYPTTAKWTKTSHAYHPRYPERKGLPELPTCSKTVVGGPCKRGAALAKTR